MKSDKKADRRAHETTPSPEAMASEAIVASELTEAELEELKRQAAKAHEHWEQLLRTAADFENFKKRVSRERQDAARYANEGLLRKLVPILDNFEKAMAAVEEAPAEANKSLETGVRMILQQFRHALTEAGLKEIDATGQPFDPNVHEALFQQESAEVPEGQVLQQIRKGYQLHDRLLRPAGVVVAKAPPDVVVGSSETS